MGSKGFETDVLSFDPLPSYKIWPLAIVFFKNGPNPLAIVCRLSEQNRYDKMKTNLTLGKICFFGH